MSLNAYRRAQEISATPRNTEYRLMNQVTAELIAARDAGLKGPELMPALHHNRTVWNTFGTLCASSDNQLPEELRARLISIAMWVDRHTSDVVRGRESIEDLIHINRAIIEGLSSENR